MPETATHNGWFRVAFGDVVKLSGDRSSDPAGDGFERYVGLEHIESGDLRIRRWGAVADGTTFTSVFRPGHVLFGKRRAYQRKIAVADFSGVCSGDIYVFEPRNSHLLPELLPFICETDQFFNYAVGTSAGSLSPRTNWDSLAAYEFSLPPLEEQQQIAGALVAAGRVSGAYEHAAACWEQTHLAVEDVLLRSCQEYPESRLRDVCTRVGVGIASSAAHAYRSSGVPMIRNNDIKPGGIDCTDLLFLTPEFDEANRSKRVHGGDVVTARTGVPGASAVVPLELDGAQTFTTLISTPRPQVLDSEFLCWWINSAPGSDFIASRKGGGVQQNMNAGLLQELPIRLPPLHRQKEIVARLQELTRVRALLASRLDSAHSLRFDMREFFLGTDR